MKVLVTGASGLLGSTVAAALVARGDEVTTLQRRPSRVAGARDVRADLLDPGAVAAAAEGSDGVVHLAAKVGVGGDEAAYRAVNVDGTAAVLAAAAAAGVRRVVHVSSPSVAHTGSSLVGAPAGPADPQRARGAYARTKAAAELLALEADGAEGGGPAVVAVRPHVVWGPGDTALVGRVVERARAGRLALVGGGSALIDTTYVDDAAAAIVAALDRAEAPDVHGRAFVVSSGQPRTVHEVVTRFCLAAGVPPPTRRVALPVAWTAGAAVEAAWALAGRAPAPLRRRVGRRVAGEPPLTRFLAEQMGTAHWFDQRATRAALHWAPVVPLDEGFERLAAHYAAAGAP